MAQIEDIDFGDFFQDPQGYYPPEKQPTNAEHRMLSGQTVHVRLVGSHPLYVRPLNCPFFEFCYYIFSFLSV